MEKTKFSRDTSEERLLADPELKKILEKNELIRKHVEDINNQLMQQKLSLMESIERSEMLRDDDVEKRKLRALMAHAKGSNNQISPQMWAIVQDIIREQSDRVNLLIKRQDLANIAGKCIPIAKNLELKSKVGEIKTFVEKANSEKSFLKVFVEEILKFHEVMKEINERLRYDVKKHISIFERLQYVFGPNDEHHSLGKYTDETINILLRNAETHCFETEFKDQRIIISSMLTLRNFLQKWKAIYYKKMVKQFNADSIFNDIEGLNKDIKFWTMKVLKAHADPTIFSKNMCIFKEIKWNETTNK
jgi:hypothetical protein